MVQGYIQLLSEIKFIMQSIWNRIEVWLEQNCPEILQEIGTGAKESEIHNCENRLGILFPKELTEFYFCHNGQSDLSAPLMGDWHLLSLRNVTKQWEIMQELMEQNSLEGSVISDGKVQPVWWHSQWIPDRKSVV